MNIHSLTSLLVIPERLYFCKCFLQWEDISDKDCDHLLSFQDNRSILSYADSGTSLLVYLGLLT